MTALGNLLVRKMIVITWKDRMASAIPTASGSYVIGSFPSVESAENMKVSFETLRDINNELIEYYVGIVNRNPADFQAIDETLYLTGQNETLTQKIADIEELIASMRELLI